MKINSLRMSAMTGAALCALTLSTVAQAADNTVAPSPSAAVATESQSKGFSGKSVRLTQQRLNNMGFYSGPVDGTLGEVTRDALRDFQAQNGLAVTGSLTSDTYQLIKDQHDNGMRPYNYSYLNPYRYDGYYGRYAYTPPYYGNYNYAYNGYSSAYDYRGYRNYANWSPSSTQNVPIRFGRLEIQDNVVGGTHNFSVMLNGQSVLQANNQPLTLRVSNTYRLNGEDAVIFTAYDGTDSCSYKSYLLTVRADGTYVAPQQVGNCTGNYQARIEAGQLYISFADDPRMGRYAGMDTWRYGYGGLNRI